MTYLRLKLTYHHTLFACGVAGILLVSGIIFHKLYVYDVLVSRCVQYQIHVSYLENYFLCYEAWIWLFEPFEWLSCMVLLLPFSLLDQLWTSFLIHLASRFVRVVCSRCFLFSHNHDAWVWYLIWLLLCHFFHDGNTWSYLVPEILHWPISSYTAFIKKTYVSLWIYIF